MRTFIAIVLSLVLALVLGVGLFFESSNERISSQNGQEQNASTGMGSSWLVYQRDISSTTAISIEYPQQTTIREVEDGIYEIKYFGPDSEPGTEITDGYYASIDFTQATDLDAYLEAQEPRSEPQPLVFNGYSGVSFTTQSELGDQIITHIAYQPFPDTETIIDIGYSVYGDSAFEYRNELLDILSTLKVRGNGQSVTDETILHLAMLDYDEYGQESDGPVRGCDRLVFIEQTVSATTTPLNAALQELFAYESTEVGGWQNFIANTNDTLSYERSSIEDGTASIYLSGELSGLAGVCDNPRTRIQIEETALHFDTVDAVVLYLNGEETELQPSGRGD